MKDKIHIAAGIVILLIVLALIVTPVAAVNTPWKITPATKNIYNSHTPPVKINNPNFFPTYGINTPDDSRWNPLMPVYADDYGWRVFGTTATLRQDYFFTLW